MVDKFIVHFRDFAIQTCSPNDYGHQDNLTFELVKYNEDRKTCFVVALLEWNSNESKFELKSVGLRLMEYYEPGLNEFILKICELLKFTLCEEVK